MIQHHHHYFSNTVIAGSSGCTFGCVDLYRSDTGIVDLNPLKAQMFVLVFLYCSILCR